MVIFGVVAIKSWMDLESLRSVSRDLAIDTLPGLVHSALAQEKLLDNHQRVQNLLAAPDPEAIAQTVQYLKANSTDSLWEKYAASVYESEDRKNYEAAMAARQAYLTARTSLLDMLAEGRREEGLAYFSATVSPLFEDYRADVKVLLTHNVDVANQREQSILRNAVNAPLSIAALAVFTFAIGCVLGLRAGLGGGFLFRLPMGR